MPKPKIIPSVGKSWSIKAVWNEAFDSITRENPIPRDYLYASEVGYSFINVYFKMQGVAPTNYPTGDAKRKMEAGKVWEAIIRMVLKRAGIMQSAQEKIDFNLPGLLSVHGKLDFIGGGRVDLDQAAQASIGLKALWEELDMPEIYIQIAERTLNWVIAMADQGELFLETMPLEIKSLSKYVWDMMESTGKPMDYHVSQCFHYTHGKKLPKGRIIYVNRDDCRLEEKDVFNNDENLKKYTSWVTTMTDYWNAKERPPKESLIHFNDIDFKFRKKTMEIEWSPYLTMIYGFEKPMDYREYVKKDVDGFNYTFKRCVEGAKLTTNNLEVMLRAEKQFPRWDEYVQLAKTKKQEGQLTFVEAVEE